MFGRELHIVFLPAPEFRPRIFYTKWIFQTQIILFLQELARNQTTVKNN